MIRNSDPELVFLQLSEAGGIVRQAFVRAQITGAEILRPLRSSASCLGQPSLTHFNPPWRSVLDEVTVVPGHLSLALGWQVVWGCGRVLPLSLFEVLLNGAV